MVFDTTISAHYLPKIRETQTADLFVGRVFICGSIITVDRVEFNRRDELISSVAFTGSERQRTNASTAVRKKRNVLQVLFLISQYITLFLTLLCDILAAVYLSTAD